MEKTRKLYVALLTFALVVSSIVVFSPTKAEAWTEISLPYTITQSGNYRINSSWTGSGVGLSINASNVVVDGQNFPLQLAQNGVDVAFLIAPNSRNVLLENINQRFAYTGVLALSGNYTITNCKLTNNTYGVQSNGVGNFTVKNSHLDNCTFGLSATNATHYYLKNCVLNNTLLGVNASDSKNFSIENSTLSGSINSPFPSGIFAFNSSVFQIKGCSLSNYPIGLVAAYAENFAIQECKLNGGLFGFDVMNCNGFSLLNCTVNDQMVGLYLEQLRNFTAYNCSLRNNEYGFYVYSANNFTIQNTNINIGAYHGLAVENSHNFNVYNTSISNIVNLPNAMSCIGSYYLNSTNYNVKGIKLSNNSNGLLVFQSENATVQDANITNSSYMGAALAESKNITIRNMNIYNSTIGMDAGAANNTSIINSYFINNSVGGLSLELCDNINLTGNVFNGNGVNLGSGYGGLQIICSNCTLTGNRLTNNYDALLWYAPNDTSDNFTVTCAGNKFENNKYTILFNYQVPDNSANQKLCFYNNLVNDSAYVDPESFNSTLTAHYPPPNAAFQLNCTMQLGTRAYSLGSRIGGNFWAHPNGTGFSETAADSNGDGFTNQAFDFFGNGTVYDFLPYSNNDTATFVFLSGTDQTLFVGEMSAPVKVQLRDSFGNISTGTTFNLSSDSASTRFYRDNSISRIIVTSAIIPPGSSIGTFFFSDGTIGNWTISVSTQGTNSTTAPYSIIPIASQATPNPTSTPAPTTMPPPTTTPTSNPAPTPTPPPNEPPVANQTFQIVVVTGMGSSATFTFNGNISSSQVTSLSLNTTASYTIVTFYVTGESGTVGFVNVTVPKSVVPSGSVPILWIDAEKEVIQTYSEDSDNYYVWFTTEFSSHQIDIVFAKQTAPIPIHYYLIIIVVVIVGGAIEVLLLLRSRSKKSAVQPPASTS